MFESVTSSQEPLGSGSAEASASTNETRAASSSAVRAVACSTIAAERSTPITSVSGKRRATANAATPVPLPRSSARRGGGTCSSACASASRWAGPMRVCQTGASRSNCRRIGPRKTRQSRGSRMTAFVATLANLRPADSSMLIRPA